MITGGSGVLILGRRKKEAWTSNNLSFSMVILFIDPSSLSSFFWEERDEKKIGIMSASEFSTGSVVAVFWFFREDDLKCGGGK